MKIFYRLLVVGTILLSPALKAQTLRLAVAANAQFVIKKLQADFKAKTGIELEAIIGSSGKLAAQIKNGAPFDIFLSADMEFPENLQQAGLTVEKPVVYALGSLIVCTNRNIEIKNWNSLIRSGKVGKIAIANPALAPYGKAAEEALRHFDLWKSAEPVMVMGESISQVNTYITTGVVDLGFTTESLVHEYRGTARLNWQRIDPALYTQIQQGMVILRHTSTANLAKAQKFAEYLSSPSAKKIFQQSGYRMP